MQRGSCYRSANPLGQEKRQPCRRRQAHDYPFRDFATRHLARALRLVSCLPMAVSAQVQEPLWSELPVRASEIERRQEQELEHQRARAAERPDILSQPPAGGVGQPLRLPAETPCFTLSTLQWEGEPPPASLLRATQAIRGQCLGEQGLRILYAHLMGRLIEAGFITSQVLIPEQSLTTGHLILHYKPGRIAAVKSEGGVGKWRTVLPNGPGGVVDQRDLDQALENLRRLGSQAHASIDVVPGSQPGLSDIVIHPGRGKRWHAYVGADNAGLKEMGRIQLNAGLTLDSPLFLYDQLSVAYNSNTRWRNADAQTRAASVNYNLPLGYCNLFTGVSLSHYRYQLAGAAVPIFYSGTTKQWQAGVSFVPYRGPTYKGSASFTLLRKYNANAINDYDIEPQRRDVMGYEFHAAHRHYVGRTVWDIGGGVRGTLPQFSSSPGVVYGNKHWDGRSTILSASAGLYWPFKIFHQSLSYRVNGQLQYATTPLVPADYFTIGNRYSVRGFDGQRTLASENGWTLRNDLSLNVGGLFGVPAQELYTGLDVGRVGGPFAQYLAGRTLVGTAIGFRGRLGLPFGATSYDLSAGWPLYKPAALKTASTVVIANFLFEF